MLLLSLDPTSLIKIIRRHTIKGETMNRNHWRILGLFGALLFIALVTVLLVNQNQNESVNGKVPPEERSLAHQLAISNAGRYVPEDHKTVEEFEDFLSRLEEISSSSREEINRISKDSIAELKENYDTEVKLLEFMRRAAELADNLDRKVSYEEIAAKVRVILSQEKTEA